VGITSKKNTKGGKRDIAVKKISVGQMMKPSASTGKIGVINDLSGAIHKE
jgi:hypothetical protein